MNKEEWMDKEDEWIKKLWHIYIYSGILAIKRNTFELVLMKWMNLEPIIQSEVKREEQISYINAYMWNLEKGYRWTYPQGRNRDAGIETGHADIRRVGKIKWKWSRSVLSDSETPWTEAYHALPSSVAPKGGTNWEMMIDTYTLPYVKQIASGNLL